MVNGFPEGVVTHGGVVDVRLGVAVPVGEGFKGVVCSLISEADVEDNGVFGCWF